MNTWEAGGGGTVGRNGREDTSEMWSGWVMNHDMLCKLTLTVCEEGQHCKLRDSLLTSKGSSDLYIPTTSHTFAAVCVKLQGYGFPNIYINFHRINLKYLPTCQSMCNK